MIAEPTPGPEEAAPTIDAGIMSDFAQEAEEHLGSAESNLLALEKNPEDMETINAVFRSFHTIKGAAGFLNLGDITRVAHAIEDVLDAARKGKLRLNASVLDAGFSAIDILKDLLADARIVAEGAEGKPREMKDLLVKGFLSRIVTVVRGGRPGPEAAPPGVEAGLAAAPADKAAGEARKQDQQYVRVATEKLDHLVNMVGELVIAQTQVSQNPEMKSARDEKLLRDISQLNRITRDIQEVAMSMRMVPIRATFERMARLARDLARKFEKPIDFEMAGEETEVDKNVVEEIVDPLTHMMRNALDHGLEPVEDRAKAGKPANGLVSLEAYHKGGNIVIELRDDGRGIDREKVLKKAVERGLARPEDEYTDEQVYAFLFMPGFSTAEKVSDVSGRGVGMDVVRRNIEKLRGKVEIRSEKGKGSTFTIQLPLTLAIIEGMVVGVGPERYILPLTSIVRSLRPSRDEIFTVMDRGEMARVEGDLFPIVRLHGRYGVDPRSTCPWECLVVLVEAEGGKCCLMVDELLGIQQVVIKGLEDDLRNDKSLSGCTILGDGRVGLILDVNDLVRQTNGKAA
jgi:two-component system chemotaxis sensor kinase CheA